MVSLLFLNIEPRRHNSLAESSISSERGPCTLQCGLQAFAGSFSSKQWPSLRASVLYRRDVVDHSYRLGLVLRRRKDELCIRNSKEGSLAAASLLAVSYFLGDAEPPMWEPLGRGARWPLDASRRSGLSFSWTEIRIHGMMFLGLCRTCAHVASR